MVLESVAWFLWGVLQSGFGVLLNFEQYESGLAEAGRIQATNTPPHDAKMVSMLCMCVNRPGFDSQDTFRTAFKYQKRDAHSKESVWTWFEPDQRLKKDLCYKSDFKTFLQVRYEIWNLCFLFVTETIWQICKGENGYMSEGESEREIQDRVQLRITRKRDAEIERNGIQLQLHYVAVNVSDVYVIRRQR